GRRSQGCGSSGAGRGQPGGEAGVRVSGPLERMGTWLLLAVGLVGGGLGWVAMRLTVVGGCGAGPEAGQACSGFLVEHDGFRLVLDLGYATVPRLLGRAAPGQVDAVFISHGHPDHCADLNPLLRARVLRDDPAGALPVYALPGALDAVLALDRPGMLAGAPEMTKLRPGGAAGDRAIPGTDLAAAAFGAQCRRAAGRGRGGPGLHR